MNQQLINRDDAENLVTHPERDAGQRLTLRRLGDRCGGHVQLARLRSRADGPVTKSDSTARTAVETLVRDPHQLLARLVDGVDAGVLAAGAG